MLKTDIMNETFAIQCLWIGKQISRMERLSMKSFLNNSHTVHLYTYDHIKDIPEGIEVIDANKIVPAEKIFKYKNYDSYAGFANLFRYKLLLEKGGFWSDLDIVCLRPITTDAKYVFASERRPGQAVQVNNCFMGAPTNSEIMEYCYSSALGKKPKELHWGETGPKLLTEAVIKFELDEFVTHPDVFCPVDYWNCQYFITKSIKDIDEDAYAIHLWNEMWKRNTMDKSAFYSENCLYEELQSRYNS